MVLTVCFFLSFHFLPLLNLLVCPSLFFLSHPKPAGFFAKLSIVFFFFVFFFFSSTYHSSGPFKYITTWLLSQRFHTTLQNSLKCHQKTFDSQLHHNPMAFGASHSDVFYWQNPACYSLVGPFAFIISRHFQSWPYLQTRIHFTTGRNKAALNLHATTRVTPLASFFVPASHETRWHELFAMGDDEKSIPPRDPPNPLD